MEQLQTNCTSLQDEALSLQIGKWGGGRETERQGLKQTATQTLLLGPTKLGLWPLLHLIVGGLWTLGDLLLLDLLSKASWKKDMLNTHPFSFHKRSRRSEQGVINVINVINRIPEITMHFSIGKSLQQQKPALAKAAYTSSNSNNKPASIVNLLASLTCSWNLAKTNSQVCTTYWHHKLHKLLLYLKMQRLIVV